MKLNISFAAIVLACGLLTLSSCDDKMPDGPSTKVPAGTGTDDDDEPAQPGDDVVSPTPSFGCLDETTTVDPSKTYQTIAGFGASDCWLPNQIGQYWSSSRRQIADLLFSQKTVKGQPQGIGLSVWRVNLGAGSANQGNDSGFNEGDLNNRAEAYLVDGKYDWGQCAGQQYFMEQARNAGCESFVLFSNSPLVQYTLNGKAYSEAGSQANLKDDCYDDFAVYMATVAKHFRDAGYNISHISPVNEPQNNWDGRNQEGSGWQNAQVARLARELDAALTAQKCNTKIVIPEAGAWGSLYQGSANNRENQIEDFFNPSSANYVGNLANLEPVAAGHSYWSYNTWSEMRQVRAKAAQAAQRRNIGLWQTEWSMLGDAPADLGDYDAASEWDIAQYMSRIIHNDLTIADVASWSYWTAMSVERWSQKNRFELIKTTPAGGEYSNDFTAEGSVVATHNLWVMGNYSLFIRPGYQRIALDNRDEASFFGSAYISPDGNTIVAVYTNTDKEKGRTLSNTFADSRKPQSVTTYTSSAACHLEPRQFNTADKVFVDPSSVTTVVYKF